MLFKIPGASAQTGAANFEPEIGYYRQVDTTMGLPDKPILFAGSSSIKNWQNFDSVFNGYVVLNRGFGGCTINDVIYYADDVLLKYDPKQIVLYVGENDFAASDSINASEVFSRFKKLYSLIRNKYPEVPVVYLSLKPSPAKYYMFSKIAAYNQQVKDFIATQQNIVFVDLFSAMLDLDGNPDPTLFYDDMTHMNLKGYAIWNNIVTPLLIK